MLKIRLAWLWWARVRHVRITLVTRYLIGRLTCERHEREFCTRPFKITELEKGRWSWISNNCSEAFHTDSWLAEANPGHSDRDAILKALLPGPRTVVLFGPGKARMHCGNWPWNFDLMNSKRHLQVTSKRNNCIHALLCFNAHLFSGRFR